MINAVKSDILMLFADFGETVMFLPADGSQPVRAVAIFGVSPEVGQLEDYGGGVVMSAPSLLARTEDVKDIEVGDLVEIRDIAYRIMSNEMQGNGISNMILTREL